MPVQRRTQLGIRDARRGASWQSKHTSRQHSDRWKGVQTHAKWNAPAYDRQVTLHDVSTSASNRTRQPPMLATLLTHAGAANASRSNSIHTRRVGSLSLEATASTARRSATETCSAAVCAHTNIEVLSKATRLTRARAQHTHPSIETHAYR